MAARYDGWANAMTRSTRTGADDGLGRRTLGLALLGLTLATGGCSPSASGSTSVATRIEATSTAAASVLAASPTESRPTVTPTPTLAPSASASVASIASPTTFTLASTAFGDGKAIPRRFTCDGADVSPDLEWTGAPEGTRALTLIVTDRDANDFVHWLAFDIIGTPDGGLSDALDAAAKPGQGLNDFGKPGYGGPCPPSGRHAYRFTLYALDRTLGIGDTPGIDRIEAAMKGHVLGQVTLTETYQRP